MTSHEELPVDEDGIPVLSNVVHPEAGYQDNRQPEPRLSGFSVETTARELLGNPALRKALDELAAELSLNIYQHIDRSIRPVIEQAITSAMDEACNNAYDEIRHQLESAIPDIFARILEEASPGDSQDP
ncbi:MAG: hypothetical protein WCH04_04610 [Gammaproteobacteria bacterium]